MFIFSTLIFNFMYNNWTKFNEVAKNKSYDLKPKPPKKKPI